MLGNDFTEQRVDDRAIGDVHHFVGCAGAIVRAYDMGALTQETRCGSLADAGAGSDNYRYFSIEAKHVCHRVS